MVILFDQFNLPKDIFEVIFATEQQSTVAHMLIDELKEHGLEMGKTEMSLFANRLHEGVTVDVFEEGPLKIRPKKVNISYNKRQFYDRILTPMKSMGLIDYDLYKKTYKLSDKFYNEMLRIGIMWKQELQKAIHTLKIKKS